MNAYNPVKAGQTKQCMIADFCELIVRRPGGAVETIKNPKGLIEINDIHFARFVADTRKAGRGEVVSFKNHKKPATYVITAADAATDSSAQIARLMAAGE